MDTVERRYALTKLDRGDYVVPSNDGRRLYRVRTYEDGPSHGLWEWERDRTFWGVWQWTGSVAAGEFMDPDDDDQWAFVSEYHDTRRQAIEAALER